MKFVPAKCPICGADLNIEENSKIIKCEYCNTSLVVEDNKLDIPKNDDIKPTKNNIYNKHPKKKQSKAKLIISALALVIANIIAIKVSWDYENPFGAAAFLLTGLTYLTLIRDSYSRKKLFIANIIGVVFFVGSLILSLYIYNMLPGYVDKWENDNIILTIKRKHATIEFKKTGVKETNKYSSDTITEYTDGKIIYKKLIKISNYNFIYTEDKDEKNMCLAESGKCIEELTLVK